MDRSGVFLLDASFVVTEWGPTISLWTGIAPEDAVGKNIFELFPGLSRRSVASRFEAARDLGTAEVLSPALNGSLIACPPRCHSVHFDKMQQRVTISRVSSDKGDPGIRVLIEDVTEKLERDREIASRLRDPDESVRMGAAKDISAGGELSTAVTDAAISALGDNNWRIRRKLVEALSDRATPEVVDSLLNAIGKDHFNFGLLNSAVQVLQNSDVDATGTLLEFLHSDDADLRVQAALVLGQQRNKAAVPELIKVAGDAAEDNNVRAHAIEALGNIRASDAVEPLLAIANTRDFFLAFSALMALKIIGTSGISEDIVPLLGDAYLREIAADTLGSLGDRSAVEPIVRLLNTGELTPVTAAAALTGICEHAGSGSDMDEIRRSLSLSIDPDGMAALADALGSADRSNLLPVINIAGWVEDSAVAAQLATFIEDDELGPAAVTSLARHGASAIPYLAEALRSDELAVKRRAARGLAEINSVDATHELIASLDDPGTASIAAEALSGSTDPHVAETVIARASASAEPKERAALLRILGKLTAGDRFTPILAACDDDEVNVRIAALEQLPGFDAEAAIDRLIRALREDCPQVRAVAARSLANLPSGRTVDALRSALNDSDAWTRYFAVRSLGIQNDIDSRETIKSMAEEDEAEQVRVAAAEVLSGESWM